MNKPPSGEGMGDIIVVDDDLFSLRVLTNILAQRGYQVRSARSGSTALMMAGAAPPELFLLDIQMPDMDGFQVCMELKSNPATRDIPVLFISAGDNAQDRLKSFENGGMDYINKPFQEEEILARVKAHLTLYKLHTDLIQANSRLQKEILEREHSQLALRASEASLRAQYDGIPLPTHTWAWNGSDLILVDYNRTADIVTQGKTADYIGVPAAVFFQDQPEVLEGLYSCLRSRKSIECETENKTVGIVRSLVCRFAYVPPDRVLVHTEDITERKQLERELVNHIAELAALHRISKILTAVQELPEVLKAVCETISILFKAPLTLILFHRHDGDEFFSLIGYEQGKDPDIVFPQETGWTLFSIFPELQTAKKPILVTDFEAAPLPYQVRDYIRSLHLYSGLIVPLITSRTVVGILVICSDANHTSFEQSEGDLAETIAADIASAIEHEYLSLQARQAAVDAERQRLARDLHDSVTQSIYSLTLLCSGWENMARQGNLKDPADSFRSLGEVGQQALREMRLLLYHLRPSLLEEYGLVEALKQRLDSVETRANIVTQLNARGNLTALPPKIEQEIFNIAQEALNNSLKHSQAEHVRVYLQEAHNNITLIVDDDGRGFDTEKKYVGMGLGTMQERARSIEGEITIQSEKDHGTRVSISVPEIKDRE
jgi:signal transduction histidine kinase/DNA-binding response OmpR family regulator